MANRSKSKSKKNGVRKYDWNALKQEFFNSDALETKAFCESRLGHFDGNMAKKMRGWPTEKKAWKAEAVRQALKRLQEQKTASVNNILDKVQLS